MKINSTEIKHLEPIKTIALTHIGNYSDIGEAFEKLAAWAGEKNLWAASPKMAGVYHDCPMGTPTEELRSEACLEDLSGAELAEGMHHYTISGGRYFITQVEVSMSEYGDVWQKAEAAVIENGYEHDARDHYEYYVSCAGDVQDANAPWIVEIRIPIKE